MSNVEVRWWWLISWFVLGLTTLIVLPACAAFEIVGRGARTEALGGAFIAGTDAAEAIWFNPAGNARVQQWRVGTTHALLYPGLDNGPNLSALAATMPLGPGGLQLGLSALNAEDWQEIVGAVAYGVAFSPRWAVGVTLRSSGWKTSGLSHRMWDIDMGGIYEVGWILPQVYLRLALVSSNILRANEAASGRGAGQGFRGIALAASIEVGQQQVLLEVERKNGQIEMRGGYETKVASLGPTRFRFGGRFTAVEVEAADLDVGFGYSLGSWQIDYAYTYPLWLTGLGGIHQISLVYNQR